MPSVSGNVKVMQVITKGETGGAQTHVLELCRALGDRVIVSGVIGGRLHPSRLGRELEALGVPVDAMPQLTNSMVPWQMARAVARLLRLVRERRPDVIHAHSAVAGVASRIVARMTRTPVIYTVHGFSFKHGAPLSQRAAAWLTEWMLAPLTTHMICVSQDDRQLASGLPIAAERVSVVMNGLADNSDRADPWRSPARVTMVGRLARQKRPDLLLKALASLRDRRGEEVAATFMGDGPDLEAQVRLAGELGLRSVQFLGDVQNVPCHLTQHSVLVLMANHEGLPIAVIEAMRAGLPIVASDLPGLREMMRSGEHGLLVPNDSAALASALEQLIESPELRRRYGHAARQRYENLFESSRMADEILSLYARVARHA
jgi:glycosyltransferase involved in cell wall biosynthesis